MMALGLAREGLVTVPVEVLTCWSIRARWEWQRVAQWRSSVELPGQRIGIDGLS